MSDLSAPLRPRKARVSQQPERAGYSLPVARLAAAGIVILLGGLGLQIVLVETPEGGRPVAEVPITSNASANRIAGANAQVGANGFVVGPETPIDEVEQALQESVTATPTDAPIEPHTSDLVEETQYGAIPRISAQGGTPFAAYSRPSVSYAAAGGKPRIAVVVTGLGISEAGTLDAIERLPDTVTLAFAPYGGSLQQTVGQARAEGHEIYLEVPLEPFDYPNNDPGPDTLLTGQAPRENIDRLYKVMSRFPGYAGVMNNMGARFTASAADFGPVMEELGLRGLAYLDDGSSNRSLAPQLTQANRIPYARAEMVLDANPARARILDKLDELEALARRNGQAVGIATALPVSIQTIAEWAKGLEERDILIVPASALMKS